MSDCLWPHEPQHARPPCPSPTPGVPNPHPLSRWCNPIISSSVVPFSSCPQSFPTSGSFQMSQLRWPKYWSISFSLSPSNEYSRLISFRMDWLDLLAVQGILKSLLQGDAYFSLKPDKPALVNNILDPKIFFFLFSLTEGVSGRAGSLLVFLFFFSFGCLQRLCLHVIRELLLHTWEAGVLHTQGACSPAGEVSFLLQVSLQQWGIQWGPTATENGI